MARKTEDPIIPPIYFDEDKGDYFMQLTFDHKVDDAMDFRKLRKSDAKLHLRRLGLDDEDRVKGLTATECVFIQSQIKRSVQYVGPLAGYKAGSFKTSAGDLVLVTRGVSPAPAARGKWPFLQKFIAQLLPDGAQQDRFLYWLANSYRALTQGTFAPGQCLVFIGPSQCGKNFAQTLITELFGGRVARPYEWFIGETAFNGELAQCEHWMISDERGSTDIRTRRAFGNAIKRAVAEQMLRVHPKGRQAITVERTFRRVTISCNEEPENVQVLPPLDDSILDKLIILKCSAAELSSDYTQNMKRLREELPAMAYYLSTVKLPTELAKGRFNLEAYAHPEIVYLLYEQAPEYRLLAIMDEVLWSNVNDADRAPWTGTAVQLEKTLRSSEFVSQLQSLVTFSAAVGTYLGRLASKRTERVTLHRNAKERKWVIVPP